jgi:hypothetical protein
MPGNKEEDSVRSILDRLKSAGQETSEIRGRIDQMVSEYYKEKRTREKAPHEYAISGKKRITVKTLGYANRAQTVIFCVSLGLLASAEITLQFNTELGLLLHELLIIFLIAGMLVIHRLETQTPAYGSAADLLKAMILAPLARILGFALPLALFKPIYWPLLVSIPLLMSVWVLARILKVSAADVGLVFKRIPLQILIAATGIAFGFIEYAIIHPAPLISSLSPENLILPGIILIIFTGLTEELVFRGMIQNTAARFFGPAYGIIYSSIAFSVMYIRFNSLPEIVFVLSVSLFYGYTFQRTRILTGVIVSHGLTNVVLFLIAPFIIH